MIPTSISGKIHTDFRGSMTFVNGADLAQIRRFYTIEIPDTTIIRAWQGHAKEQKWFYPLSGCFQIKIMPLSEIGPEGDNLMYEFILDAQEPSLLHIPGGYYNGFKSKTPAAKLLVFSDITLDESQHDDFRLSLEELPWE